MDIEKRPVKFTVALGFILANTLIWLVFAILTAIGALPLGSVPITLRWIMAALALTASVVLFALVFLLTRHHRSAFYFTLATLFGLIVLSFTDEVGAADMIYLVIALVPFVLLLASRRWYFQKRG